ncbi:MAG TPA: lmo0937 family membrane protein [Puia sp.]|jgi:hypothetical protein|nr:lmo0937 family membrane protein [Puia sp.]
MENTQKAAHKAQRAVYKPCMANATYILAVILLGVWMVGFFGFHAGNAVHLLLAMAMLIVLANIIRGA